MNTSRVWLVCLANLVASLMAIELDACSIDEASVDQGNQPQVNGPAELGQFGWTALIKFNDKPICIGNIIHERHILSDAHCFCLNITKNDIANYSIQLAIYHDNQTLPFYKELIYRVEDIFVNQVYSCPDFNEPECDIADNLAIVRLEESIDFNSKWAKYCNIKPITLMNQIEPKIEYKFIITGSSSTQMRPSFPEFVNPKSILHSAKVNIRECKNDYIGCSFASYDYTRKLVGNSGAALIAKKVKAHEYELMGITSSLIYDKKSHFSPTYQRKPWIRNVIQEVDIIFYATYIFDEAYIQNCMQLKQKYDYPDDDNNKSDNDEISDEIQATQVAGKDDFPWFAIIVGLTGRPHCGRSIVDDRQILKSRHCFTDPVRIDFFKIAIGKFKSSKRVKNEIRYDIELIVIHEKYEICNKNRQPNDCPFTNDIGSIKLKEPINFRGANQTASLIRPIKLTSFGNNHGFHEQAFNVTGFEFIEGDKLSEKLMNKRYRDSIVDKFFIYANNSTKLISEVG